MTAGKEIIRGKFPLHHRRFIFIQHAPFVRGFSMDFPNAVDTFLRRHPRIFLILVILLTAMAGIVMLGGLRDVGLVYKAF